MLEISLHNLSKNYQEATVQTWFVEEGDPVEEGDDLVELLTADGVIMLQAPVPGVLSEVYYDEGEVISKDDLLCIIDNEAQPEENE